MHYEAKGNAGLTRPVLDLERGYLVTPMARGLRLTTGAEFARRDDPPSSAQLDRVEPSARELFPIGARKDAARSMGATVPAGHAPGHRAVPGKARPMARFRPPPSRPHPRPNQRAPAGGTHERRNARGRSRPVPRRAVWTLALRGNVKGMGARTPHPCPLPIGIEGALSRPLPVGHGHLVVEPPRRSGLRPAAASAASRLAP